MKGLEVGDTLVRLKPGYFLLGDRLKVTAFAEGNQACFANIDQPGYSHSYAIPLPLNEEEWDVDHTAGPHHEPKNEDALTYHPWYGIQKETKVCSLCGSLVAYTVKHDEWHLSLLKREL